MHELGVVVAFNHRLTLLFHLVYYYLATKFEPTCLYVVNTILVQIIWRWSSLEGRNLNLRGSSEDGSKTNMVPLNHVDDHERCSRGFAQRKHPLFSLEITSDATVCICSRIDQESVNIEMKDRTAISNTETAAPSTVSVSNTNAHRVRARIQFATLCYSLFLAGWNDGTTGPLLPRIQEVYHVRSLTFICRK